jgi:hypothetical protein
MSIDTTKGIAGLKGALRYVRAYRGPRIRSKARRRRVERPGLSATRLRAQLALLSSLSIRLGRGSRGRPQATALSRKLVRNRGSSPAGE